MERTQRTLAMLVAVLLVTVAGGGVAAAGGIDDGARETNSVAVASQADCSYPVRVTDVTGTEVTLDEQPDRIVVLQPSDAQLVWGVNASDRVVGMPQGSSTAYLNGTEGITNVKNDDGTVDVEQVTNLSADVVLAANITRTETVDQLRSTGTPVYHFGEVKSIEEIYTNLDTTGALVGNCQAASERVDAMQTRIERIRQAVADEERPTVLYEFYGYTTGSETHIHDLIRAAGGENVAADGQNRGYYELSQEVVVSANPEWIVHPSDAPAPSGSPYNSTTAVAEGQVFSVNANYASQAGPHVVIAIETMAQQLHPDAFDENGDPIVETPTPTADDGGQSGTDVRTATNASAEDATMTGPTETTEGSGPGFTPVTVVLAVVGIVVALGVRRKGV